MSATLATATELLNSMTRTALSVLGGMPYSLTITDISLSAPATPATELPVVLGQRIEGAASIWLTLSCELATAFSIADNSLKAFGTYAVGFSEITQNILISCFEQLSTECVVVASPFLAVTGEPLLASSPRLSYGQRLLTASRSCEYPFRVRLDSDAGRLDLDIAVHGLTVHDSERVAKLQSERAES